MRRAPVPNLRWLACAALGLMAGSESTRLSAADTPAAGVPVNVRLLAQQRPVSPVPYDSDPAFVVDGHGKGFAVWHSYAAGEEWIVGRALPAARDTPMIDLGAGRGVVADPEVAAGKSGELCATWATLSNGRWRVMARRASGADWSAPIVLSTPETDALHPVVTALGGDVFAVAWVEFRAGRFAIVTARLGATAGRTTVVSAPDADAFRPALLAGDGGNTWAFWDSYHNGTYSIQSRQLTPELGPIERVSTSPDRCLKPVATRSAKGETYVAWVKITDVTGGEGVIDQLHTIEVAVRRDGRWKIMTDAEGRTEAAVLAQGLLAKIAPKPGPTGGYLGRRRDPMWVRDGDGVWLLWERKANHVGDTSNVTGELAGRRISGDTMAEPVALAHGWVDYRVAHDAEVHGGAFPVIASALPRDALRTYSPLSVVLAQATPLKTEAWPGWSRVALPLAEAAPQRHEVRNRGKSYQLFWMDSHVHSGLTADAEGEPDEIMLYGRDRGRLDAMVMQENDFYNCPLTESEFQIGAFYARAFSRDGRFVALPGYEWTQQVPADPGIDKDQARFWRASYPNHRTIIYPRAGGPLVRYIDVRGDITKLYSAVESAGGVLHTQHPSFDFIDHPAETSIEVSAGWGVYFLNPGRIHETLNRGHRAGFVGTSDSHRRNPGLGGGLTGLYATELTPDAILEAYRTHRVFATSGSRIAIEARANGLLMGQETPPAREAHLTLHVKGTRPIRRATLIRDGIDLKIFTATGDARVADFEYRDTAVAPGIHWYYWRVEQEGGSQHYGGNVATALGHLAWSTPNWVRVGQP
ncbi:MAG: hypothetical protein EXS37_21165 [Opitutus sp.]|nr:hypothetical protein [Opitutus sp.]